MKWREATMPEALTFATGKTIKPDTQLVLYEASVVEFTDGTAVSCKSVWERYPSWSEYTPPWDDAAPP